MNKIICLESVDSTNAYLRRSADELPHGTVVLADAQTAGRGRLGRSFASLAGKGIYLSVLLRPDCDPVRCASLTPAAAVAVCRAVKRICGVEPEIKWVNDLFLGGKKICGILCESEVSEGKLSYVVVGIGLNVSERREDFPPELRETAGSLYTETGAAPERGRLALAIVEELEKLYALWLSDESACLADYRRLCRVPGKRVRIITPSGETEALAEGISDDFGLCVQYDNGERKTLHSGEISIRI